MGGVPPPLVFEVGRFVACKRSFEGLRGEVGSSFQVVGNAWVLGRIWAGLGRVLGASWAAPGHLGRLLGGSWAVLGGSWVILGGSWAFLGGSGALLGAKLEPRWTPRAAKSTPRRPKIEAKMAQDGLDM